MSTLINATPTEVKHEIGSYISCVFPPEAKSGWCVVKFAVVMAQVV
jgi:hypothetical protein